MNEHSFTSGSRFMPPRFTAQLRRSLDESAGQLPAEVAERLRSARLAALERMPAAAPTMARFAALPSSHVRPIGRDTGLGPRRGAGPRLIWRLAGVALPIVVILVGLVSFSQWDDDERLGEQASLDAAVLTDDLPIATLTDRGFAVFLVNDSRQSPTSR